MATPNHPIPVDGRFDADNRVAFDKTAGKFQYEDDNGQEWEWVQSVWIPIVRACPVLRLGSSGERGITSASGCPYASCARFLFTLPAVVGENI